MKPTSQRAALREDSLDEAKREIAGKFGGVGASGANIWPANMPRKVRRQIERDLAKRERREQKEGRA